MEDLPYLTDLLSVEVLQKIQNAFSNKLQEIETLKAYKASLIYEYVTGKKQVI